MKAVIIHAAKDLRIEERDAGAPGPGQVGVAIGAGGICGSDLHYYNHGGFGTVRVKHPMVLGHEVAGTVTSVGPGVETVAVGDRVAVSPSLPCNKCEYCLKGQQNHCLDMRFYGSAMRNPHVDGAFRQQLVAEASQCHKLVDGVSLDEGAFAEPFAVTLHAVSRAGSLLGKRVLVTGSGPIGALCVVAARAHGAREIIVTDVLDGPLAYALRVGADRTINVASSPEQLAALAAGKDVILKVDVQGTRSVKAKMPDALTIFVEPESLEALHEQLVSRKTENDEELDRRWAAVQEEMKASGEFSYRVQNPSGNPDKAVEDIERIIALAHQDQAAPPVRS